MASNMRRYPFFIAACSTFEIPSRVIRRTVAAHAPHTAAIRVTRSSFPIFKCGFSGYLETKSMVDAVSADEVSDVLGRNFCDIRLRLLVADAAEAADGISPFADNTTMALRTTKIRHFKNILQPFQGRRRNQYEYSVPHNDEIILYLGPNF